MNLSEGSARVISSTTPAGPKVLKLLSKSHLRCSTQVMSIGIAHYCKIDSAPSACPLEFLIQFERNHLID